MSSIEPILSEWEVFAREIWPDTLANKDITPATLRDHAQDILRAAVSDMTSKQTAQEQDEKSKGDGDTGKSGAQIDKASETHGSGRGSDGFELWAVVAEYRALRASVLRLWRESNPAPDVHDLDDVTRFNESIDQSLTEGVRSYTEYVNKDRELLLSKGQEARDEAETANRTKDIFLATLSHEMRTPLNAIVGWVGILRRGNHGDEVAKGLDVIERSTKAQVQLIEDVLDVSRIVSGKMRLELGECDIREAINEGVEVTRSAALAKNITINVELDPDGSQALCDSARIQQIVWNLVSNAIKFTPKGGAIGVKLSCKESTLKLVVTDSGQGIEPEILPYIFDRFRQGDSSTRRKFSGLGLGLSIVKHLVELHGGTVEAISNGHNLGATFTVRIPIHAIKQCNDVVDLKIPDQENLKVKLLEQEPLFLDGLRVLVVDDNSDAREMLSAALQSVGAVVTLAESADDAMEEIQNARGALDVLVSDLGMPVQDGFDLIRKVRRAGHHHEDLVAVALSLVSHIATMLGMRLRQDFKLTFQSLSTCTS